MENKWNTNNPDVKGDYIVDRGGEGVSLGCWNGEKWIEMLGSRELEVFGWINMPQSQEVKEELPKKGQVCWGKNEGGCFHVGHFVGKGRDGYKLSQSNFNDGYFLFAEITTKNPYEVEEEVSILETTDREPKVGDMVFAWDDENKKAGVFGILEFILYGSGILNNEVYYVNGAQWKYCSLKTH